VIVQLPFAGMVPPAKRIPGEPTARAVPLSFSSDPLQLFVVVRSAIVIAPGVVGNVSVKVTEVRAVGLLFESTICNVDTPLFGSIGLVTNDLVTAGGASIVISWVAAVPFDAATGPVTVKLPTGIVLTLRPTLVPVMVAVTMQEPLAGIVPAVTDTVAPLAALVPTQVPPAADALKPEGNVSMNAAPVIAIAVGLLNVIVRVAVPLNGIVAALKALLMFGRATFNAALALLVFVPILEFTAPTAMVLV
jgi:hypothetical protein